MSVPTEPVAALPHAYARSAPLAVLALSPLIGAVGADGIASRFAR